MLFSVLIANFNNSRYLPEALDSVIRQTFEDWEIIIVNDGSTDDFDAAISNYRHHPKIKVYSNRNNKGCGYAKSQCVTNSTGEICAFLDADDTLQENALALLVEAHKENTLASLIHTTHYVCNSQLQVIRQAEYVRAIPPGESYLLLNDGRIHHFASFKRSYYRMTSGIDPFNKKAVDQDLYYKLEDVGQIVFIDEPVYYYRIHEKSISNAGNEKETNMIHWQIALQACQRRIELLQLRGLGQDPEIKKIRTRYYKLACMLLVRKKKYFPALKSFIYFLFNGGWPNIKSYLLKLPRERTRLLKKTLSGSYKIDVN